MSPSERLRHRAMTQIVQLDLANLALVAHDYSELGGVHEITYLRVTNHLNDDPIRTVSPKFHFLFPWFYGVHDLYLSRLDVPVDRHNTEPRDL
jgi:hypothetical protein